MLCLTPGGPGRRCRSCHLARFSKILLLIGRERDQHYPEISWNCPWIEVKVIRDSVVWLSVQLPNILPYRGRSSFWGHGKQANAQAFDSKYKRFARLMCPEFIWKTYFLFAERTHRPTILLNCSLLFNFPTSFGLDTTTSKKCSYDSVPCAKT